MIYFVQRADGAIKIGTTENYHNRMSELRSKHGLLTLLGLMEGARPLEQQLHKRFASSRVLGDGLEWFYQTDELLEFIASNTHMNVPEPGGVIVLKVKTYERVRDLSHGLRVPMWKAVDILLSNLIPEGEDPLMFGRKLLDNAKPQETTES